MSNAARTVLNAIAIGVAEDLKIFDAFSPRVQAAFNYSPVKLAATPRVQLLDDEYIIAMIERVSAELARTNPAMGSAKDEVNANGLRTPLEGACACPRCGRSASRG